MQVPEARWKVRALDACAALLPQRALQPGSLIDAARKQTGLDDFGPEGPYEEALGILCRDLEQEARLRPLGRLITRGMLLQSLQQQLQLQDWITRNPAILEQPIKCPVVIIGMPRTGTTILHELLALDPANRCPMSWEVAHPFPPPQSASFNSDPRIRRHTRELAFSHLLMPGVENMHRMGAELPQECVAITAQVFVSMMYNTIYRLPAYTQWLREGADHQRVYRHHKRLLQYLQWRCPRERWVLKSPAHLWQLEALLAVYPDARLVQTHRDPLRIVSSLASMIPTMRSAYSRSIDPFEVAREWSDNCASALNASVASRRGGSIAPRQVIDIQFREFMADPGAQVQRIYAQFGIEFGSAMRESIQRYIARNPSDKHGGHRHRFADTGLELAEERAKVAEYQSFFSVASEADG
jgi:hypothetical protein